MITVVLTSLFNIYDWTVDRDRVWSLKKLISMKMSEESCSNIMFAPDRADVKQKVEINLQMLWGVKGAEEDTARWKK